MGQRLVANVYKNKSDNWPILTIYYHWSAYTIQALIEGSRIIECYKARKKYVPILPALIMSLETVGARLDPDERYRIYSDFNEEYDEYKFSDKEIDRNNGLIAVTEEQIEVQRGWAEGEIDVYLEEELIYNYCIYNFDNVEEYVDWYDYGDEDIDLPLLLIDMSHVHYEEIPAILSTLDNEMYRGYQAFQLKDGSVIQFIL